MATDSFLVERPVPNSDACILIGRVAKTLELPAKPWHAVLWIVDAAGAACPSPFPAAAVTLFPVDQCGAAQLEAAVENFLVNTPRHLPSIYVTREIPPEHESGFLSAVDVVVASVESHHRARVTRQQDAFAWQRHLFENSSDYIQRRLPDAWEGALAGLPAFICGAGPSLDVSAPA